MSRMKITGYMQLTTDHIDYDQQTRTVRLTKAARDWSKTVYPTAELAAERLMAGAQIYAVTAELPNDSVFEVRGDIDQSEGRGGRYTAGYFADYASAFRAADGLGVQGTRGEVLIKTGIDRIYTSYEDWQEEFNLAAARNAPRASERISIREIVELAPTDETALGAADPEYALWLKLNEKFGTR